MNLLKKIIKGVKFKIESRLLSIFAIFDYLRSNNIVHNDKSFYDVLLSEEENKIFYGK